MSSFPRLAAWVGVAVLLLVPLACPPPMVREPVPLLLLGPFAELAAQVQWLRFHAANLHGEGARALELAESALALDPRAPEGWQNLAAHLVFDLASREREPAVERRRVWFRAGLSVLERGAERASRPGELELFRALVLLGKAQSDPEVDLGGAAALRSAALDALRRAATLGQSQARELALQLGAESGE